MENDFSPYIWQEDPVQAGAEDCARCELSRQRTRMIWGEGNPRAGIIVVLDNPGCREDKNGTPFVCGTRQTLQLGAFEAGLTEKDLYVTYILKCRPVRKYEKDTARGICLKHLEGQMMSNDFKIAFCLGDTAVRAFFGDPEISVKEIRDKWQVIRGLQAYASYHPLAVRRRPNLYGYFLEDWKEVARKAAEMNIT